MNQPIPPAAVAVIEAALDDYRLTTPPEQQTPTGAAQRVAQYLLSSGYAITPPTPRPPSTPTPQRRLKENHMPEHITVDIHTVETALRNWLTHFEYDLHKALECGEDDSEDHYPDEAAEFFACLKAAVEQSAA